MKRQRKKGRAPELTREQITEWRKRGYTYGEMAAEGGVCVSTVKKYMDKYGLTGRRFVTEAERERFRRMAQDGMVTKEIAARFGFADSTVYKVLRQAGLVRKRGGGIPRDTPEPEDEQDLPGYAMAPPPRGEIPVNIDYGGRHYVADMLYVIAPW